MKAGQAMQETVQYAELDKGFRDGISMGPWVAVGAVILVFVLLLAFLRVYVKRAADQKTRRIILESMQDDDNSDDSRGGKSTTPDSQSRRPVKR